MTGKKKEKPVSSLLPGTTLVSACSFGAMSPLFLQSKAALNTGKISHSFWCAGSPYSAKVPFLVLISGGGDGRLLADYVNWLFFFLLVYLSVCLKKDTGGITDLCFENRGQDWWGFLMGKEKWSQREGNTDRRAEPGPSTSPQAWRRASRTRSPTRFCIALLHC